MALLDLPLECLRHVLFQLALDVGVCRLIPLRLVNSKYATASYHGYDRALLRYNTRLGVMDREIMSAINATGTMDCNSPVTSGHPQPFPIPFGVQLHKGFIDFVASLVMAESTNERPAGTSLYSLMNAIADELMLHDGVESPRQHPLRDRYMRRLSREIFELNSWQDNPIWFHSFVFAENHPIFQPDEVEFETFLAKVTWGQWPWERVILSDSQLREMLGRKARIFGSLLKVTVKSGQVNLARHLLGLGAVNISNFGAKIVEACAYSNPEMVALLTSTGGGGMSFKAHFQQCIKVAIDINAPLDIILPMIEFIHGGNNESLLRWPFRWACSNGRMDLVLELSRRLGTLDVEKGVEPDEEYTQLVTAWKGHRDMLRFLYYSDIKPSPYALRGPVMNGDIETAELILQADAKPDKITWTYILLLATWQDKYHFSRAMVDKGYVDLETLVSDTTLEVMLLVDELMLSTCGCGDVFLTRELIRAGLPIERFRTCNYSDGGNDVTPMLAAVYGGQEQVISALLELGATEIDKHTIPDFGTRGLPRRYAKPRENRLSHVGSWRDGFDWAGEPTP